MPAAAPAAHILPGKERSREHEEREQRDRGEREDYRERWLHVASFRTLRRSGRHDRANLRRSLARRRLLTRATPELLLKPRGVELGEPHRDARGAHGLGRPV